VRNTLTTIFLVAVGLLAVAVPLSAHHGNAAFDTGSKVTVKGTVTEWYWANPHCFLKFDVTDDKGGVVHWVAETSNPADMVNRGWGKQSLKPGEEVTVTMQVVKGGNPIGRVQQIVLANGRILGTQLPPEPKPTDDVAKP
jgi:predicted extracellular nuclease